MPKRVKKLSDKSVLAPEGYRRTSFNLKTDIFLKLRGLSASTRKTGGVILEELIENYGDQIESLDNVVPIASEPDLLDGFIDVSCARKSPVTYVDPKTIGLNANGKASNTVICLGEDIWKELGYKEGDAVSLLLNGTQAAIVRGGIRILSKTGTQLRANFPKIIITEEGHRIRPTIKDGIIFFDIPESAEIKNLEFR